MRTERRLPRIRLAGLALLIGTTTWLAAADDKEKAAPAPAQKKAPQAKTREPAQKGKVVALVGGDIYTITHEVIRGGTVLVKDGKIFRVGQDIPLPAGATVVDVKGKVVTPGFVALSMANVGLRAGGGGPGGGPGGGGARAGGKLADSLDPLDRSIKFCLGVGITTGCVEVAGGGMGRGNRDGGDVSETNVCPCCGLAILPTEPIVPAPPTAPAPRRQAILKMSYGDLKTMLVSENPFYHLPIGGLTGPLNHFNWRQSIAQARKYVKDQAEHEKAVAEGESSRPPRKTVSDDLIRLVKKLIPLRTDAASVAQIRDMVRLAKELDYNLVLENPSEAWLVPDELSEAKARVILTPRSRRRASPGKEDTSGSSIETSARLEKTGVPFAIATQYNNVSLDGVNGGRDLTGLPLEAAFAVRGGCTEESALAGLTIVPARILGLESKIGSIDEGKDADLLILNGPPLDYRTTVETAFVAGKIVYERDKDRVYPTVERGGQ